MAEHGTRTMYVHYGCRCEACCKAEHQQYLKRKEAQARKRTYSKWGDDIPAPVKTESQRRHNLNRYNQYTHTRPYAKRIRWQTLVERGGEKCAICGCAVDPSDTWVNKNGRKCFGGRYPTVDHIVPLKLGGADELDNVQLLCKRCNSAKGMKNESVR